MQLTRWKPDAGQPALADQIRRRRSRLRLGSRVGSARDVMPFILRDVTLCRRELSLLPGDKRAEAWSRLAKDLDLTKLNGMTSRAAIRLGSVAAELVRITSRDRHTIETSFDQGLLR